MQDAMFAPCPKCQAMRTLTKVKAQFPLVLVRPGTYGIGSEDILALQAILCTNCGYTELYADSPNKFTPEN